MSNEEYDDEHDDDDDGKNIQFNLIQLIFSTRRRRKSLVDESIHFWPPVQ